MMLYGVPAVILAITFLKFQSDALFTSKSAGPFEIVVKEIADCENQGIYPAIIAGNKIKKINRTFYAYSTNVYLPDVLDDDVLLNLKAAVWGNGGWKNNFFVISPGSLCMAIQTYAPGVYKELITRFGSGCPIPAGNYTLRDIPVNLDLKWPSLPYNKYRTDLETKKKGKEFSCKRFVVDVVPRHG